MIARIFMTVSACIPFILGAIHFVYTFWGSKLTPQDSTVQIAMSQTPPLISNETTMWRAWIGFNATHSMGLLLFGLIYGYLALAHSQLLFRSPFLLVVGLMTLGGFFVLSKAYFFSVPFAGITIALLCYVASIIISRLDK